MKYSYPKVLSEDETVDRVLAGASIARFGDGELRLALGGTAPSQKYDPALAKELKEILAYKTNVLPCIPNYLSKSPKRENWKKYAQDKFFNLYRLPEYGSSFITRPDSAPWIDRADYWGKIRSIWSGKDVVLVAGSERSLTPGRLWEAKSVKLVKGQYRDSYDIIDQLVEEVGRPSAPVLLCLGATATVMARRLADKEIWAIDLGHAGMMMKNACTGRWAKGGLISA